MVYIIGSKNLQRKKLQEAHGGDIYRIWFALWHSNLNFLKGVESITTLFAQSQQSKYATWPETYLSRENNIFNKHLKIDDLTLWLESNHFVIAHTFKS